MTEKEEKKRLDERLQNMQTTHSAPELVNTTHLKIITERKGIFIFPSVFPSTCLLQLMINLEFRNVCSLFSLQLPWVVTPDPTRSPEHLWKPSDICSSKLESIRASGPASSLLILHPSLSSVRSQNSANRRPLFRQRRLKQTGQAFPVGGTWEQRHSWARHLHFLSLLTPHWKT